MRGVWFAGAVVLGASMALGVQSENPPMPGFDTEGSDPEAIAVADEVMEKLGGRRSLGREPLSDVEILRTPDARVGQT